MKASRLISLATLVMSIAGLGVSGYLTSVHYASVPLACGSGGLVNCEQVLTSSYSTALAIPWSVGGIAWFAVSGVLAAGALVRESEPPLLQPAQLAWSFLGLGVALYLVGVEVIAIGKICAWCTSLHVLIVAMLILTIARTPTPASASAG